MRWRLFSVAVGLASFSTIALELMLTRIFSVTMYYHFAFMVISIAMLGLSVSGVAHLPAAAASSATAGRPCWRRSSCCCSRCWRCWTLQERHRQPDQPDQVAREPGRAWAALYVSRRR